MKALTGERDNEEKITLTYGGANDDRYHLTSTSPFCTSSWASEVEERKENFSFPQEYTHTMCCLQTQT